MFKVGRVTHYYDKIGVAVVELSSPLSSGDTVRFVRGGEELFDQKIDSIQVEHKKLDFADRGSVVGLKTEKEVREGAEVYKL